MNYTKGFILLVGGMAATLGIGWLIMAIAKNIAH